MRSLLMTILLATTAFASGPASAQPPAPPTPPPPPPGAAFMGRPFLSPMGEPFHSTADIEAAAAWFAGADANKDGILTADELAADAKRFFALLDGDADGRLNGVEQERYETDIAPMIRGSAWSQGSDGRRPGAGKPPRPVKGGGGGHGSGRTPVVNIGDYAAMRQGAGRFSYLNIPEPVSSADINLNFVVTLQEFVDTARARFRLLDTDHDGKITPAELPKMPDMPRRR